MTAPVRFAAGRRDECCYGIDIADDGALIVAQRLGGQAGPATRYPAGVAGVFALREHISSQPARPRICIRSCGGTGVGLALGLAPLDRAEVILVAPRTIEASRGAGREVTDMDPEERAQRLAQLAERLV
jgi:transposase